MIHIHFYLGSVRTSTNNFTDYIGYKQSYVVPGIGEAVILHYELYEVVDVLHQYMDYYSPAGNMVPAQIASVQVKRVDSE